ncbi:MAG TPA: hypothetical protein VM389_14040 [Phycisphaerae bacterium]|nr:hypothetical protein [Phycisphaerae bacterium]
MLALIDWNWTWDKYAVFSIPFALVAATALGFVLFRNTLRTRIRVGMQLRDDPDINEWLIIFDWSRKVLYVPMILASIVGAVVMLLVGSGPGAAGAHPAAQVVGGIWLGLFILCFLIDEYEMSIKVLAIVVLFVLLMGLWLHMLGWLGRFFEVLGKISVQINWTGFLFIAVVFSVGVAVSWLKGLFHYVAITPNYLNIQVGLTETGEQISREDYNTRVDTGDFLERILGFGRIVITFRDNRRLPLMLLVGRIGRKAQTLESIRGKLAVDRHQPGREGDAGDF